MPQITVTINGRPYPVACEAGEEERVAEMARYVDGKMQHFAAAHGQIGEARLLVLAALLLADELTDAREAGRHAGTTNGTAAGEAIMADGIAALASRIEAIASKLETAHI
jgi:cell division protein ZapA